MRGLQPVTVELVDYDEAWPATFERYADRLRVVLGDRLVLIEHVGSAAVPRLVAKAVTDIVIGVDDPDDEAAYLRDLETEGYELRVREPGHRCLRGNGIEVPVNLHGYRPDALRLDGTWLFGTSSAPSRPTGTDTPPRSRRSPAGRGRT